MGPFFRSKASRCSGASASQRTPNLTAPLEYQDGRRYDVLELRALHTGLLPERNAQEQRTQKHHAQKDRLGEEQKPGFYVVEMELQERSRQGSFAITLHIYWEELFGVTQRPSQTELFLLARREVWQHFLSSRYPPRFSAQAFPIFLELKKPAKSKGRTKDKNTDDLRSV